MTSFRPPPATAINRSDLLARLASIYGSDTDADAPVDTANDDRLDHNAVQTLIENWSLLQIYGEHALGQENEGTGWTRRTLPERLATLLVAFSDETGVLAGVSHQTLADFLGTARENVGAMLRAFRRQGFVELGARRIQILDPAGLREVGDVWEWA